MTRTLILAMALAVTFVAGGAHAQSRAADALVERGIALRREGRDVEALELFEEADALGRSPKTLAQIGLAAHALGDFVRARGVLRDALSNAGDAWIASRREVLEAALDDAEAHLGRLHVEGGLAGDRVLVDGRAAGLLPLAEDVVVPVGRAEVSLERAGARVAERRVTVEARTTTTVPFETPAAPPPAAELTRDHESEPAPLATVAPSERHTTWVPYVGVALVGAGAAGLGVGITMNVLRENDAAQFRDDAACGRFAPGEDGTCDTLYARARDRQAGAIAGYVAGGALVAAGVLLLVLAQPEHEDGLALSCAPSFGARTGITCMGSF